MLQKIGIISLALVCCGWFAYQTIRVTPQDDPKAVVIWSGWGEQAPAFELFHKWWKEIEREKGIRISHVSMKNEVMIQKVNMALALGHGPALFQSFGGYGLQLQSDYDMVEDIYPEIRKRGWDTVLSQTWLDLVTFDKKFFGIPIEAATYGIIFNTTLFKKFNVPYPTDFASLINACDSFKAHNIVPFSVANKDETGGLEWIGILHIRCAGGDHYVNSLNGRAPFRNEKVKQAFDIFRDFVQKGYFGPDPLGGDYQYAEKMLCLGGAAMTYVGNWYAYYLINQAGQFRYLMNRFPAVPGGLGGEYDLLGGSNTTLVIPRHSPKKEATLEYLDMLVNYERMKEFAHKQYYIVPLKRPYLDSLDDPLLLSMAERSMEARKIFNAPHFTGPMEVARVYREVWLGYAVGSITFDEACGKMQGTIDGYFGRERKRRAG